MVPGSTRPTPMWSSTATPPICIIIYVLKRRQVHGTVRKETTLRIICLLEIYFQMVGGVGVIHFTATALRHANRPEHMLDKAITVVLNVLLLCI